MKMSFKEFLQNEKTRRTFYPIGVIPSDGYEGLEAVSVRELDMSKTFKLRDDGWRLLRTQGEEYLVKLEDLNNLLKAGTNEPIEIPKRLAPKLRIISKKREEEFDSIVDKFSSFKESADTKELQFQDLLSYEGEYKSIRHKESGGKTTVLFVIENNSTNDIEYVNSEEWLGSDLPWMVSKNLQERLPWALVVNYQPQFNKQVEHNRKVRGKPFMEALKYALSLKKVTKRGVRLNISF